MPKTLINLEPEDPCQNFNRRTARRQSLSYQWSRLVSQVCINWEVDKLRWSPKPNPEYLINRVKSEAHQDSAISPGAGWVAPISWKEWETRWSFSWVAWKQTKPKIKSPVFSKVCFLSSKTNSTLKRKNQPERALSVTTTQKTGGNSPSKNVNLFGKSFWAKYGKNTR